MLCRIKGVKDAKNTAHTLHSVMREYLKAELEEASGGPVMLMSGVTGEGVTEVLRSLRAEIDENRLRHRKATEAAPAPWQP